MVHMTGMVGFVHAYYVLGLKHKDGWIGYGGRIYDAQVPRPRQAGRAAHPRGQGHAGPPQRERASSPGTSSEFFQGETLVYTGEQSAMWMRVAKDAVSVRTRSMIVGAGLGFFPWTSM